MPQEYKAFIERMLEDAKMRLCALDDTHRVEVATYNATREVIENDIQMYEMFLRQKEEKEQNNTQTR